MRYARSSGITNVIIVSRDNSVTHVMLVLPT